MKEYVISGYEPLGFFRFFEDISRIPRGSGNEKGIADHLVRFAEERGIEYYRDSLHNVLYRIPATAGRENEPSVLLQGHTDMVCEKNADTDHDFLTDPLKLYVDEKGWLHARGTTLGGDDGVAVAAMMAVADGLIDSHPPIECLFTVSEEVGLDGANGFDYSRIKSRILLNMDSEEEDAVIVGCAGGVRSDLLVAPRWQKRRGVAIEIALRGLKGGHSGEDINKGRANANLLMGRILLKVNAVADIRISSIVGGSKDNAIPRECTAVIVSKGEDAERVTAAVQAEIDAIAKEISSDDAGFCGSVTRVKRNTLPARMCDRLSSERLITLLGSVRNGVLKMGYGTENFVEWSRSLGVIETKGDAIRVVFSSRSSIEAQLDASTAELDALARLIGAEVSHHGRYPGWEYNPVSPIREKYLRVSQELLMPATVRVIHAGLECGVIASNLPGLDAISFGPNMRDIHSPEEALDLKSTERFFRKLAALLA